MHNLTCTQCWEQGKKSTDFNIHWYNHAVYIHVSLELWMLAATVPIVT